MEKQFKQHTKVAIFTVSHITSKPPYLGSSQYISRCTNQTLNPNQEGQTVCMLRRCSLAEGPHTWIIHCRITQVK